MKSKLQWLAASVAALAFTVPTLAAGDRAPYSAIVVFGTSLSDSGNAFALRGGANTPPDYLFWDGIHPTHAAHALVAHEAARVLAQQ